MQVLLWIDCVYPNTYVYVHASAYMQALLWIDRAFTCAFALELAVNLYANFFWDFVTDGWSMFDMLVVCVSFYAAFARDGMHIYACMYVRMFVCLCVCIYIYTCK